MHNLCSLLIVKYRLYKNNLKARRVDNILFKRGLIIIEVINCMMYLFLFLDEEYFFTDPESKLSKYSTKSWKSSSTYVSDFKRINYKMCFFPVSLYYFVPKITTIRETTT